LIDNGTALEGKRGAEFSGSPRPVRLSAMVHG